MLKNTTKNALISRETKYCNNILSKAIGLMFSRKQDRALIFSFKNEVKECLHMFFVFYPIDVIFLNKDRKVVEMKENFKPFTFYMPKKKARYIIELLSGSIKKSKTSLGDMINIKNH